MATSSSPIASKERVKEEALEILSIFQANINEDVYCALQKALSSNLIIASYANMDISAWRRLCSNTVAAESLYQHFATHRHVFQMTKHEDQQHATLPPTQSTVTTINTVTATRPDIHASSKSPHHDQHECKQCGITYTERSSLRRHCRNNHANQPQNNDGEESEDDEQDDNAAHHACSHCRAQFDSLYQLNQHYFQKHAPQIRIRKSPKAENRALEISNKFKKSTDSAANGHKASAKKYYFCSYSGCGYKNTVHRQLCFHIRQVHKGKPYECNQCDASFSFKQELNIHHCQKHSFPNTSTMSPKRRKYIHDNTKLPVHGQGTEQCTPIYKCEVCGATFTSSNALGGHKSAKHSKTRARNRGRYKCELCGATFTSSHALGGHKSAKHRHRNVNINGSAHECDICGATFTSSNALGGHKSGAHRRRLYREDREESVANERQCNEDVQPVVSNSNEHAVVIKTEAVKQTKEEQDANEDEMQ